MNGNATDAGLNVPTLAQARTSLALWLRWRSGDKRFRIDPYRAGTDTERRAYCDEQARRTLVSLDGLAGVW